MIDCEITGYLTDHTSIDFKCKYGTFTRYWDGSIGPRPCVLSPDLEELFIMISNMTFPKLIDMHLKAVFKGVYDDAKR